MADANKLDDLLDWCIELEFPAITLWVFSTENRKRPPAGSLAFLLPSRKSSGFWHVTVTSIAGESACLRLGDSSYCLNSRSRARDLVA
jgi:Putative undecaprenyl diphosphate synthase